MAWVLLMQFHPPSYMSSSSPPAPTTHLCIPHVCIQYPDCCSNVCMIIHPPYQHLCFCSATFTPGLLCLPQYHHLLVVRIIDNPSTMVRLHFDLSRASMPLINIKIHGKT